MKRFILPIFVLAISVVSCTVQPQAELRIAFYNVENLFDTIDDPNTNDAEYLAGGRAQWNSKKYAHKLDQLTRVLSSIDTTMLPAIIGLCEVENRPVLEDLIKHKELSEGNYQIIHKESPDFRGIDNAIIYRSDYFTPTENEWINVSFPFDTTRTTRDILYTKGLLYGTEEIHLFVNHWTSRWGGQEVTEAKRIFIADLIKSYTDAIIAKDPQANIIIMGDLNDNPTDKSLTEHLSTSYLTNLSAEKYANGEGTLYYRSWDLFDQMIVSNNLIDDQALDIPSKTHDIFKADWLLFTDNKGVQRPNRTGSGSRYYGGFSDHLAVSLSLKILN